MRQETILFPMFFLALLTFGVGFLMVKRRFKAVRDDGLNPSYFKLNRGGKLPEYLEKVSRHYINLFECPVLFYVVSLLIYSTKQADATYLTLAWLFVATRYLHSYIHITYNALKHRMVVFLSSAIILIVIWVRLFFQLLFA